MRLTHVPQRGMALVMAMIVIVLVTLLVAGAITFTGTERAAAMIQSDEDAMSSCTQAARNLFLARVRVLLGNADSFTIDPTPIGNDGRNIYGGHLGRDPLDPKKVNIVKAQKVALNAVGEGRSTASSIENRDGYAAQSANYYLVTAVCQQSAAPTDGTSPLPAQREVEFVVRVGL